jgi:MFS family permease
MAELDANNMVQEPEDTTSALTKGVVPQSPRIGASYRLGFLLASMVAGLSSVCIKQLLLPLQVSLLDPRNTNTSFAIVAAVGAFAGLVAAPLTGALSDRTRSRWGKRKPWILGGISVGVVGLLVMAWATTIPILLLGEILEQIGVDAVLSNVTTLIPDQIPEQQQATTSALNGMAPVVGGTVGLMLVVFFTNTRVVAQGYILLAVVSRLCTGIFLLALREQSLPQEQVAPFHLGTFLASFAHPLRSHDFAYTLASRLLVFFTFTMIGSYLLFYLRASLHASATLAAHGVFTYQLISTAMLIIIAPLTGYFSHRFHCIKPFAATGALVMALSMLMIVLFPSWKALYGAGAIFGCGFGSFLGVDIALAVQVLPNDANRGKDLGIIYTSIFLPLIVTPILGAFILNSFHNNFALLFSSAALSSVLAALLIFPIKSVR